MSARRPSLLLLPALFAASAPAAAGTLEAECRAMRALVNGDGRHFAAFDFESHPHLRLRVPLDRHRGAVVDDDRCDANSSDDSGSMECEWTFSDYASAAGFYDALLDRLHICLGQPLLPPEPDEIVSASQPAAAVRRDLREHRADVVLAGWETELDLTLTEDPQNASVDGRRPASVRYEVALDVDSGRAEEEQDEESGAEPPSLP